MSPYHAPYHPTNIMKFFFSFLTFICSHNTRVWTLHLAWMIAQAKRNKLRLKISTQAKLRDNSSPSPTLQGVLTAFLTVTPFSVYASPNLISGRNTDHEQNHERRDITVMEKMFLFNSRQGHGLSLKHDTESLLTDVLMIYWSFLSRYFSQKHLVCIRMGKKNMLCIGVIPQRLFFHPHVSILS